MAGQKSSPRQKMIGMMYLVLTALLALNISKDILDAFVVVNDGLERTVSNSAAKNNVLLADFAKVNSIDPNKSTKPYRQALEIQNQADDLSSFIHSLKTQLIAATEGLPEEVADTISLALLEKKDDYTVPTQILIGASEDGSAGASAALRQRIESFRDHCYQVLQEVGQEGVQLGLATQYEIRNGVNYNWEMSHFYNTPLAASLTMLSQIENEVRNAEYTVIDELYKGIHDKDFFFDTVAAKVMPASNYVWLGQEYKADLFLAAFSSTVNPRVFLGKLDEQGNLVEVHDSVNVDKGKGEYLIKPDREGLYQYEGVMRMKAPSGELRDFPFQSEYMVARPALTVAATKMNALYVGVPNPISISVPGIAAENIIASISGGNKLQKVSSGKYNAVIVPRSPRQVSINISIKLQDGSVRSMGQQKFRVFNLPKPYAEIAGINSFGSVPLNKVRAQRYLKADYDDSFVYDLKCKVTEFKVTRRRGGILVEDRVKGNKLIGDALDLFKTAKRGDQFYIEGIRARGSDDVRHDLPLIKLKVI